MREMREREEEESERIIDRPKQIISQPPKQIIAVYFFCTQQ